MPALLGPASSDPPFVALGGNGGSEAFGNEKAAGGGNPLLLPFASGWNPFGELRLRMLRATSQSSHERDSGRAPLSSSDSMGDTEEAAPLRQWVELEPPIAIGAEPAPVAAVALRAAAGGGGGSAAPFS